MDIHSNAAVSPNPIEFDDFLPCENMEGSDGASLEWLSMFVEDCLNGSFTSQPPPTTTPQNITTPPTTIEAQSPVRTLSPLSLSIPSKARTKRATKPTQKAHSEFNSYWSSPLLPQTHWLAESELLVVPKKEQSRSDDAKKDADAEVEEEADAEASVMRRCTHCGSHKTPQWRAGPRGPKTLCNACGVRFKSGRLLPEYRPAKSPTFESLKHSNSHKKVMEMRMATVLSSRSE